MAGVSMDVHTGMAAITFLGVFQCWRQSHIPQVFKPLQMALEVHVYLSRQVASNELDQEGFCCRTASRMHDLCELL